MALSPASRKASEPVQDTYAAIVNFTTVSREPAAANSGWKSESLPMALTPTMILSATAVEYVYSVDVYIKQTSKS